MRTDDPPHSRSRVAAVLAAATLAVAMTSGAPASAVTATYAVTGRVSVTTSGAPKVQTLGNVLAASTDGRFVAFSTSAALEVDDTNAVRDVYLRDRMAGTSTRVSLTDPDGQIGEDSTMCGMSRDGRYVGFIANGSGLPVPAAHQLYLRDRKERTTAIISVSSDEVPANSGGDSVLFPNTRCPISNNGRYVAFSSSAATLAPGDNNGTKNDIFRRDTLLGTTERASVAGLGAKANGAANVPAMSADGGTIAFESSASNLVPGDTNSEFDVFVHSFSPAGTYRMSVKPGGGQANGPSGNPSISADGLKVSFRSRASDLVGGDTNDADDVFVRDRAGDTITRATLLGTSTQFPGDADGGHLSDDGTRVSFSVDVPAVITDDANQTDDVYLRNLATKETQLVSIARTGSTGNAGAYENAISGDGMVVPFASISTDLVRNDANGSSDVFVRDLLQELTPFASDAALIRQQFVDFEGRQPSPAELAEWTARLANGERSPDEVIDALAHGPTWASKRAPLTRLYWAFFQRTPDLGGMDYWVGRLTAGSTLAKVAKQFAQSSEFATTYGALDDAGFVTLIYENIFDRDPDAAGLAFWTAALGSGSKTRGDVMVAFSESSEGRRRLAPQTDTVLIWLGTMRVMPTLAILLEGIAALTSGYPPEAVAEGARGQAAYAARVIQGP